MRLNSKGQVTIPADLRHKHGLREGDEVDVIEEGGELKIVRRPSIATPGAQLVEQMRGRSTGGRSTDDLMELLRGE
jgi:AbrB family looped-hinge helix DNA binding protein